MCSAGEPVLSESAESDGESRSLGSVKHTKKGERVKEKRLMRSAMATVEGEASTMSGQPFFFFHIHALAPV